MSHGTLEEYYQTIFSFVQHHHWTISDLENLYPYERDIYLELLGAHLTKLRDEARAAEHAAD